MSQSLGVSRSNVYSLAHTNGSRTLTACALVALVALVACDDKNSTGPTPLASAVVLVAPAPQSATVGTALSAPIVVVVNDQNGNPMSGVALSFTVPSSAGSLSATQATTDANGQASVTWTLGTVAGVDSLTISAASLPALSVAVTALPDAPAAITAVTGDQQSGTVGTSLSSALAVKVTDKYGNPVPNVTVQWSDDAGGTFAAATTTTDANGIAQDMYTLGTNPGPEDISAIVVTPQGTMQTVFTEMGS
jgi:hypothetical protein